MQLNITARHLNLTPAISEYVTRKFERVERHYKDIVWAQVILVVEKRRQLSEVVVHIPGSTFRAVAESADLYSAIDESLHKLDMHLGRLKDKKKDHRSVRAAKEMVDASLAPGVVSLPVLPDLKKNNKPAKPVAHLIHAVDRVTLATMSINKAVKQLRTSRMDFFPFINENSNLINIIYKSGDHGYGLLETDSEFALS